MKPKAVNPLELLVLTKDAQVRAYLHPVRHRMLQLLAAEPMTASQVARRLGVHPANLTHHFRALREGGLVKLVEERDVGRVVEKYFRAVAVRFEVRARPGSPPAGLGARALRMLEEDLRAAEESLRQDERELVVRLENARLPEGSFEGFAVELAALVERWRTVTALAESGRWYTLGLALYPRAPDAFRDGAVGPTLQPRRR